MGSPSAASDTSHYSNPFLQESTPVTISLSSIQLVNIKFYITESLDLVQSNYTKWSTLFMLTFRRLGLVDHVDGTTDARLADATWIQIDQCIVSWLYTAMSRDILDLIIKPVDTAFNCWTAISRLFLNNKLQRAVYTLQEFHSLFQGNMTITEYCTKLKTLTDTLRHVGSPVSDTGLVTNLICGLEGRFKHAITSITLLTPPPDFLGARDILEQEERRLEQNARDILQINEDVWIASN